MRIGKLIFYLFLGVFFICTSALAQNQADILPPLKTAKGTIIEQEKRTQKKLLAPFSTKDPDGEPEDEILDWFNLDPAENGIEGSSVNKAYGSFDIRSDQDPVIVAVIDSGIDINHEDLQGKIWVNADEIPDNGVDDDNNGFVDDIHGWNFIGGRDGSHVDGDTLEVTREYIRYKQILKNGVALTHEEKAYYEKVEETFLAERKAAYEGYAEHSKNQIKLELYMEKLKNTYNISDFSLEAVERWDESDPFLESAKEFFLEIYDTYGSPEIVELYVEYYGDQVKYYYNTKLDTRKTVVKDDPNDLYESNYGNNDVIGPDASHGTHVAGIIAADRENGIGIKGVASNVKIMVLRAVPNGDEHDKDVANSVEYAVDNGAKIINMSFSKDYSPHKHVVDEAFKYAEENNVLIIHSAGNNARDVDLEPTFPNRFPKDEQLGDIATWMNVGASAYLRDADLPAFFSNYGHNNVELFAPGYRVYSSIPDNQYAFFSGTSMAGPVVSGVAALVMSQYPDLLALDVKYGLMDTTRPYPDLDVRLPSDPEQLVPFETLSISGGVVDAFTALETFGQ